MSLLFLTFGTCLLTMMKLLLLLLTTFLLAAGDEIAEWPTEKKCYSLPVPEIKRGREIDTFAPRFLDYFDLDAPHWLASEEHLRELEKIFYCLDKIRNISLVRSESLVIKHYCKKSIDIDLLNGEEEIASLFLKTSELISKHVEKIASHASFSNGKSYQLLAYTIKQFTEFFPYKQ